MLFINIPLNLFSSDFEDDMKLRNFMRSLRASLSI